MQVIPSVAPIRWREIALPVPGHEAAFIGMREAERAARFDLAAPPLLRALLVRFGPGQHRLVLTAHHLLLDGWSASLLIREVLALYAGDGQRLPRAAPYRDYLAWLQEQDHPAAVAAWREALAGLDGPTLLAPPEPGGAPTVPEQITSWPRRRSTATRTV